MVMTSNKVSGTCLAPRPLFYLNLFGFRLFEAIPFGVSPFDVSLFDAELFGVRPFSAKLSMAQCYFELRISDLRQSGILSLNSSVYFPRLEPPHGPYHLAFRCYLLRRHRLDPCA